MKKALLALLTLVLLAMPFGAVLAQPVELGDKETASAKQLYPHLDADTEGPASGAAHLGATWDELSGKEATSDWPTLGLAYAKDISTYTPVESYQTYGAWRFNQDHWACPDKHYSYYEDGMLNMVRYEDKKVAIYSYDSAFNFAGKREIDTSAYQKFGTFHIAADGYRYIVMGNDNKEHNNAAAVMVILQYDKQWNLVKQGSISGEVVSGNQGIAEPFSFGSCMAITDGGHMYLYTCRIMYNGHQSDIGFDIDLGTMTYKVLGTYVSHSFKQLIALDGDELVAASHGDSYPRSVSYTVMNKANGGRLYRHDLIKIGKDTTDTIMYQATFTTLTGLEVGKSSNLVVGTSIPHDNAVNGVAGFNDKMKRNVYISVLSKGGKQHSPSFKWLTNYDPNGDTSAGEPRLTPLSNGQYAMLFNVITGEKVTSVEYRLLDEAGNILAAQSYPGAVFNAGAAPILLDGTSSRRLVWLAEYKADNYKPMQHVNTENIKTFHNFFYALDVSNPMEPKACTPIGDTNISFSNTNTGSVGSNGTGSGNNGSNAKDGWLRENGEWYYYHAGGMVVGWFNNGGKWYYMDETGAMVTGWVNDGRHWYYLKSSGAAAGWESIGGKWYYFAGGGAMRTGWLKDGSSWYYLKGSGAMAIGWELIGGVWYWFDGSGRMATGARIISGKSYLFNSSGAWIK